MIILVDDFKPASIDYSKEAEVEVGEKGEVNITLPNVEVSIDISQAFFL